MRSGPLKRKAALSRTTPLPPREKPIARQSRRRRRRSISQASPAQRAKIKGKLCVHCGEPATTPMHLWPRGLGGCDDPLCVLPACWDCHRLYDDGKLALFERLVERHIAEIAHALLHTGPISLLERLTASEVVLIPRASAPSGWRERQPRTPAESTMPAGRRCIACAQLANSVICLAPPGCRCDDPACTLPACGSCAAQFERGELDLLIQIVADHKAAIAHAQLHIDPTSLIERLTGCRVQLRTPEHASGTRK